MLHIFWKVWPRAKIWPGEEFIGIKQPEAYSTFASSKLCEFIIPNVQIYPFGHGAINPPLMAPLRHSFLLRHHCCWRQWRGWQSVSAWCRNLPKTNVLLNASPSNKSERAHFVNSSRTKNCILRGIQSNRRNHIKLLSVVPWWNNLDMVEGNEVRAFLFLLILNSHASSTWRIGHVSWTPKSHPGSIILFGSYHGDGLKTADILPGGSSAVCLE